MAGCGGRKGGRRQEQVVQLRVGAASSSNSQTSAGSTDGSETAGDAGGVPQTMGGEGAGKFVRWKEPWNEEVITTGTNTVVTASSCFEESEN
jgi:hypothetical protein